MFIIIIVEEQATTSQPLSMANTSQSPVKTESPNSTTQTKHTYNTRSHARLQMQLSNVPVTRFDLSGSDTMKKLQGEAAIKTSQVLQDKSAELFTPSKQETSVHSRQISGNLTLPSTSKQLYKLPKSIPTEVPPKNLHPGIKIFQDLNKSYPPLWFAAFELRLDCWGITTDKMRTDFLLGHLQTNLANKRLVAYQGPGADPGGVWGMHPLTSHFQQCFG